MTDALKGHLFMYGGFYVILAGYGLMQLGTYMYYKRTGGQERKPRVFSRRFSGLDISRSERAAYEFGIGLIALGALIQAMIYLK